MVEALRTEAALWDAILLQPWTLTVVERPCDVEALRAIGVGAVALSDPDWRAMVRDHREVLLIGSARRLRRDVLRAGARYVWYRPNFPGYTTVESELRDRRRCTPDATPAELREVWAAMNDGATWVARTVEIIL